MLVLFPACHAHCFHQLPSIFLRILILLICRADGRSSVTSSHVDPEGSTMVRELFYTIFARKRVRISVACVLTLWFTHAYVLQVPNTSFSRYSLLPWDNLFLARYLADVSDDDSPSPELQTPELTLTIVRIGEELVTALDNAATYVNIELQSHIYLQDAANTHLLESLRVRLLYHTTGYKPLTSTRISSYGH